MKLKNYFLKIMLDVKKINFYKTIFSTSCFSNSILPLWILILQLSLGADDGCRACRL